MPFTFVGVHPRHLESGRPLTFGETFDSVPDSDQERLGADLVFEPAPEPEETSTTEDK